jgi:hypothetical protein
MLGTVLATLVALLGGERLLSTDPEPVEITIVSRYGAIAGEEAPSFRYGVVLPDGSPAHYWSERVHTVGDRLTVLVSRGRITGRILLSEPRRREK